MSTSPAGDQIYTIRGWLPAETLRLDISETENDNERVIRVDKYLLETGEWVGNDVHVILKKGLDMGVEQALFGGTQNG